MLQCCLFENNLKLSVGSQENCLQSLGYYED